MVVVDLLQSSTSSSHVSQYKPMPVGSCKTKTHLPPKRCQPIALILVCEAITDNLLEPSIGIVTRTRPPRFSTRFRTRIGAHVSSDHTIGPQICSDVSIRKARINSILREILTWISVLTTFQTITHLSPKARRENTKDVYVQTCPMPTIVNVL